MQKKVFPRHYWIFHFLVQKIHFDVMSYSIFLQSSFQDFTFFFCDCKRKRTIILWFDEVIEVSQLVHQLLPTQAFRFFKPSQTLILFVDKFKNTAVIAHCNLPHNGLLCSSWRGTHVYQIYQIFKFACQIMKFSSYDLWYFSCWAICFHQKITP